MRKLLFILLGWILFVNLIDVGQTYWAFHNTLPVKEIGPLGASNFALMLGLIFNMLTIALCTYVVKSYKDITNWKFKIFSTLIWVWGILDTFVIINNFWVISQALRG